MRVTGTNSIAGGFSFVGGALLALLSSSPLLHAEDAVRQGIFAVRARDYQTADACFQDAIQKVGPAAYETIGNAEAAIPGRELRAICWLSAYLAVNPNAADAAKIKATIKSLDSQRRQKTLDLVLRFANAAAEKDSEDNAKAAAQTVASEKPFQLSPDGPLRPTMPTPDEDARDRVLQELAGRWEQVPDFEAARLMINMMLGDGIKSDSITGLVTAESNEAAERFTDGDGNSSAALFAAAEKDVAGSPRIDAFAYYRIAVMELQNARTLIGQGKLADARPFIAEASALATKQDWDGETLGSVATTKIILARGQIKSGDVAGAKATLSDVAKLVAVINHPGSPLKYGLLRDLADAEIDAGDFAGARPLLAEAVPLASIYSDADRSRLEIVDAQLKIGDVDGAKTTAGIMKDADFKAKALKEIALPPPPAKPGDPAPSLPPFSSRDLAIAPGPPSPKPVVIAAQWMALLELDLDAPCFTAFKDDADCDAIASEIETEPVRLARGVSPYPAGALEIVTRRMVDAQGDVDRLLKEQFEP